MLLIGGCSTITAPPPPSRQQAAATAPKTDNLPDHLDTDHQPSLWLDRVVSIQPAGKSLGRYEFGLSCAGPYGPVYWSDVRRFVRNTQLQQAGRQALVQNGHRPPGAPDDVFRMPVRVRPDWLVGARVTNMDANLCRDTNWLLGTDRGAISGQITLEIAWQILDTRTNQTILRANSTGTGRMPQGTSDGIAAMMEMAFGDAFDRLSADHLYPLMAAHAPAQAGTFAHSTQPPDNDTVPDLAEEPDDDLENPDDSSTDATDDEDADDPGIIKAALVQTPDTARNQSWPAPWPTPWTDNLTAHAPALLGGILRTEPGQQPAFAMTSQQGGTLLLTLSTPAHLQATQKDHRLIVRRADGQTMHADVIHSDAMIEVLHIQETMHDLVPIAQTIPGTGQPVALISAIKGKKLPEPILTSGLIARRDKKTGLLWLDVPRAVRDRPMMVLDARGNVLAITQPNQQENGLIAARAIDRDWFDALLPAPQHMSAEAAQ